MTNNYSTGDSGDQPGQDLKDKIRQDLGNQAREASRRLADKGKE
ncbi:MAG: hypothetical protein RLZZ227_2441, partial [Pseudomonadota bacterium]